MMLRHITSLILIISRLPVLRSVLRTAPIVRGSVILFLCLLVGGNSTLLTAYGAPEPAPASPDAIASQVFGLLNQWRIESGLWPFKENPLLDTSAMDQANYVATHVDVANVSSDEAWHKDAQKRMPRDRMVAAPYNWPYFFDNPGRVIVGENAALGGTAAFALNFWKNSPPHRTAALNGAYREIGIAVVPMKGMGYLIYTDFGSRPGVLTTLVSASKDTLYFTNETAKYTSWTTGWKPADTQIKITDATGKVIADTFPIPRENTYKLPGGLSGTLQIEYMNGSTKVTDTVNLDTDIAILPGVNRQVGGAAAATGTGAAPTSATVTTGSAATSAPAVSPTGAATAVPTHAAPLPTNTPHGFVASLTPMATLIPPTVTPTLIPPTLTPTAIPPTMTPTSIPPTAIVQTDLSITYNPAGLNIRNTSGQALDMTGFVIGNMTAHYPIEAWSAISAFPINAFPAGVCLQFRLTGEALPDATGCVYVRAVIEVSVNHRFWTEGPFTIVKNNTLFGTCDSRLIFCAVKLH